MLLGGHIKGPAYVSAIGQSPYNGQLSQWDLAHNTDAIEGA